MSSLRDRLLILAFGAFLFLPFLGSTVLWDFDEAYFGSIAREMGEGATWWERWIVPTYNGGELGDKPIVLFWAMRLSFLAWGGVSEFAARFPSALWSLGTLLWVYEIGRRLWGRGVALRSAFLLATSISFAIQAARAATTDAPLVFWCTATITAYLIGVYRPRTAAEDEAGAPPTLRDEGRYFPVALKFVIPIYACLAMAVLCKGPVFFVLVLAVIGFFCLIKTVPPSTSLANLSPSPTWWRGLSFLLRLVNPIHFVRTCRTMRLGVGVIVVLAIAAPWYLAVGVATDWAWWELFFWKHNFARATTVMHNARGAPYYYILALLFGTFPWSVFFLPICLETWRRLRFGTQFADGLIFAICWCGVVMAAFSIAATKFPNYILPMYPAAALLAGHFFEHWSRGEERIGKFWTPLAISVLGAVGVILAATFLWIVPHFASELLPNEEILSLAGFFLIVGAVAALMTVRLGSRRGVDRVLQVVAVLFLAVLVFWGGPRIAQHQHYRHLFANLRRAEVPQVRLVSVGCLEPSWVFYWGEPIRRIDKAELATEVEKSSNSTFFLIRSRDYDAIPADLREATTLHEVARVPYWGRPYKLVVLGKESDP